MATAGDAGSGVLYLYAGWGGPGYWLREAYTERLIQAGVASRAYDMAPLQLDVSYREALQTFRETL